MARSKRVCRVARNLAALVVPIGELSADPANLRVHGDESIDAIAASLRRFGQQKPIIFDGNGVVVAGNGTLEAARRIGWTHIAAVRSDLVGVDRTAYAIADNRIAELSAWDQEGLAAMLRSMPADAVAAAGFNAEDVEELLAGVQDGPVEQDAIPAPLAKAVSRPGDLWILGKHRLLCGDCTVEADVRRIVDGQRAVLFATDPPYLVGYDGTNHPQSFSGGGNKDWSETYGKTWDDAKENVELYDGFLQMAVRHAVTEDAAWYCWHASRRQAMLEAAWAKVGAFVHAQVIWTKNRPVLTRTWYLWQHEPCFFGWIKGKKPRHATPDRLSTVWAFDTLPNGEDRPEHPTPKPIELFAIPIRQHTRPGEICYEPFSGSGTQIIAAEQTGRRCFAVEIEPRYVDVAIRRWQRLTGQAARLDKDRRAWARIAAQRGVDVRELAPCPPSQPASATIPDARTRSDPGDAAKPTTNSTAAKTRGARRRDRRAAAATAPPGDG